VFLFFGSAYFILFITSLFLLPAVSVPKIKQRWTIAFTLLMSFVAFYEGLNRYFLIQLQLSDDTFMMIRLAGIFGTALSLLASKIIGKVGIEKTFIFTALLTCISTAGFIFTEGIFKITILSIFFVAAISLFIPTIITLIGTIANNKRASAISLYSFTLLTGAGLSPIITGDLPFHWLKVFLFSISL
jgi:MFS transporter, YNFM family, putative membrane transport protein